MDWTCPNCGRTFRSRNQAHSCIVYDLDWHYRNRSRKMVSLFQSLQERVLSLGPMTCVATKVDILFSKRGNFLSVKIHPSYLELVFYLNHLESNPIITKTFDQSKTRVIHQIKLYSPEEFTDYLLFLLQQSYDLIGS